MFLELGDSQNWRTDEAGNAPQLIEQGSIRVVCEPGWFVHFGYRFLRYLLDYSRYEFGETLRVAGPACSRLPKEIKNVR